MYGRSGKGPECSINFITSHDGFTLKDLVTFSRKHNEANGEDNEDGIRENYSSNYGIEGDCHDSAVECIRRRQIKNLLLTLAISRGIPMLLAGDEFGRSQRGNNNAYCQDNETGWVDWSLLKQNHDILEFARGVLALRRTYPVLRDENFYTADDLQWFNPAGVSPAWTDASQKCLACLIRGQDGPDLYLMFNAKTEAIAFRLPPLSKPTPWRLIIDTAKSSPLDVYPVGEECSTEQQTAYVVQSRASVVLVAQ